MKIESEVFRGVAVAILFIIYLALWAYKRVQLKRQEGFDPEVLKRDNRPSQRLFASFLNIITITLIGLAGIHTRGVKNIPGLYYLFEIKDSTTIIVGLLVGGLGLSLCLLAQATMGAAWRVGIDKETKTKLIDCGIFSYCRNPTYSGLFLVCLSTFIIFPTMSILIWVVSFYLLIEFQVRLEEEHLIEVHGLKYTEYCSKVKRYIPWIY
jgi:protein-S-isoprenylcysteine O-methyltransferase Ste14